MSEEDYRELRAMFSLEAVSYSCLIGFVVVLDRDVPRSLEHSPFFVVLYAIAQPIMDTCNPSFGVRRRNLIEKEAGAAGLQETGKALLECLTNVENPFE